MAINQQFTGRKFKSVIDFFHSSNSIVRHLISQFVEHFSGMKFPITDVHRLRNSGHKLWFFSLLNLKCCLCKMIHTFQINATCTSSHIAVESLIASHQPLLSRKIRKARQSMMTLHNFISFSKQTSWSVNIQRFLLHTKNKLKNTATTCMIVQNCRTCRNIRIAKSPTTRQFRTITVRKKPV